jgi:predicted transglutaminase-like cysteine proteinase
MKPLKLALFLCVSLLTIGSMGTATPALAWTQMPTGAPAIPPAGFLGFCAKHLPECLTRSQEPTTIELTDERLRALEAVQTTINASITPRLDPAHVWDYSTDGTGDCNKYALTKRRDLLAEGFPRGAVLLATATTERGEGHLVLVVRTDRGDLVLDNRVQHVVDWSVLPYHWVSVQSQQSPVRWVSILSQPIATADASRVIGPPVVQAR